MNLSGTRSTMGARLLALALALLLVLSACQGANRGADESPREVTIAMGFIPNVQFTPMYVALERGYFEAEGLKVTLDYGMETDLLQRLATNDLQFAIGSGDQVVLARANGLPVRYVLNWYRRFPVCVVSLAEKGITEPAQLAGKTVGTPALSGASYIGWLAFLDEVGLSSANIDLQVIGYTQTASLAEKRVDAAICYALNEPVQMAAAGYQLNVFYLDRYTQLVSNGLITNDETIEKQPELVEKAVRAFLRGLQDTIAEPEAAFAIARKAIPEMDEPTAKLQRAVLDEAINFWRSDPLGASDPAAWAESAALLKELGLIANEVKPGDLYTNRFIK
ncbi:MAG: ABC transporter substrate-binding protein [Chloroflexi bacterium]|nr:ABC transporter substrate-binding protein [Chloroflexota bacterium]